jgi:hypothetical protein
MTSPESAPGIVSWLRFTDMLNKYNLIIIQIHNSFETVIEEKILSLINI